MPKKILIVDDNPQLRTLLRDYLNQEGFETLSASNGQEALFLARQQKPDVVILDLMMPEMDGYTFLRQYSREADTPVIILTAKLEENDRVLGLELGADDYITKPFSLRELTARIRAILRRMEKAEKSTHVLRVGDLSLDLDGRIFMIGDRQVDLTTSEFDLLSVLMAAPGRTFSRLELLERIQGTAYAGYERTIDVHIYNLRRKIEKDASHPRYIETVYGAGYRFTPQKGR